MMWRERILAAFGDVAFRAPASDQTLRAVEAALGNSLPADLRQLLRETDGATHSEFGYFLLWPTERIRTDNIAARTSEGFRHYMSLGNLLFFADAGNGDMFGYGIDVQGHLRRDIYSWNHEDDSRTWVAPDLQTFLAWMPEGKIVT